MSDLTTSISTQRYQEIEVIKILILNPLKT